jgi:ComF family protein
MVNNWLKNNQWFNLNTLTLLVFKQYCLLCASTTNNQLSLCKQCIDTLPRLAKPSCPQCGLQTQGEICGKCLKQKPHYDETTALFAYAFPFDVVLQEYKYNCAMHLSKTLAELFIESALKHNVDVIIPMPLHPNRLKERGFNQSVEVANIIAQRIGIPIDNKSCLRIKNTPPQAGLPLKERLKNMRGAFSVNQELANILIKGNRVAIIDDVITTGSTVNELSLVLKKAGAISVHCYAFARAT